MKLVVNRGEVNVLLLGLFFIVPFSSTAFIPQLPFSIVLLALGAIAIGVNRNDISRKPFIVSMSFLLAFLAVGFVSIFWTHSPDYGINKLLRIVINLIPLLILPFVKLNSISRSTHYSLVVFLVIFWGAFAFNSAQMGLTDALASGRRLGMNYNPIVLARDFGFIAILSYMLSRSVIKSGYAMPIVKIVYVVTLIGSIIVVILTGSKAPFLALILSLFLLSWLRLQAGMKWLVGGFLIVSILCILWLFDFSSVGQSSRLFDEHSIIGSADSRLDYYQFVMQEWLDNSIIGVGIGGFSYAYSGIDALLFPHNIFLEVLFETGIVGLLLFVFILVSFFHAVYRIDLKDDLEAFLASLTLFTGLNAQVSNDLGGNMLFLAAMVAFIYRSRLKSR